jgi:uncharacterized protein (TIGR02588 family)
MDERSRRQAEPDRIVLRPDQGEASQAGGGSSHQDEQSSGSGEKGQGSKAQQKRAPEGQQEEQTEGGEAGRARNTGPTTTQWIVGAVSTLLVLALLGFVIYEAASVADSPPVVTVRVEGVRAIPGGYVVEVTAYNQGGSTAMALEIEGTLKQDTVTVETSTATVQYVPPETQREAGLYFTKDPRQYTLEVRPLGYDRP